MMNNGNPKLILKAELIDKKIVVTRNSNHLPSLDYIIAEINCDIMELRMQERTKKEMANKSIIQTALPNFMDKIRGKR